MAGEREVDDVSRLHPVVGQRGRREQEAVGHTGADVAGGALVEATTIEFEARGDDLAPEGGGGVAGDAGHGKVQLIRSGKSWASPSVVAAQTPRSVMRPVTSRAGVTSNAGFAAALPSGVRATVVIEPSGNRPVR